MLPGDAGYEEATCSGWSGQYWNRSPVAVARCSGTADVADSVRLAVRHGLEIAVHAGGHHSGGLCTTDGGLLIDLADMNAVVVDSEARRAIVQGGATLGDLDRETQAFGLAAPVGVVSMTGVAGLALGGGIGWLQRKHGLTCDNIVRYQVVTASGEIVRASAEENADLFWGLRGGGGNFGVVTAFEFVLHPAGPEVLAGPIFFGPDRIPEIVRWYRDWIRDLPNELTTLLDLMVAPPAPFLPPEVHGKPMVAVIVYWSGGMEDGLKAVAELKALADPVVDMLGPIQHRDMQRLVDPLYPNGGRYAMRSLFLPEVTDEALDAIIAGHAAAPARVAEMHFHQMGGAVADVAPGDSAWPDRSSDVLLALFAVWDDAEQDAEVEAWFDGVVAQLAEWGSGRSYCNYMGGAGADSARAIYGDELFERLVEVKRRWDPENVFRVNHNIDANA